jgi:hypothetical protein
VSRICGFSTPDPDRPNHFTAVERWTHAFTISGSAAFLVVGRQEQSPAKRLAIDPSPFDDSALAESHSLDLWVDVRQLSAVPEVGPCNPDILRVLRVLCGVSQSLAVAAHVREEHTVAARVPGLLEQ